MCYRHLSKNSSNYYKVLKIYSTQITKKKFNYTNNIMFIAPFCSAHRRQDFKEATRGPSS